MSNMKNGFSTLNRWLGKKNKDKSASPNGKLSKSSTNLSLSVSTTNINETSQLEYNRITPLPVVTSNAPFEQTFRITVLLPKDQLYVARLGARVPMSKLLELVCENKQLDAERYEFRNPVDPSQIYNCDLTIGAVGLSEVRLCHKSEVYDNFNAEEVIKLHRTSIIRDSLSSSEFSSRNSKHTTKTASPYSSSNSLNSMDSTGMNYTRTPVGPPPAMPKTAQPKMMAPPRKKRAAPRPPSQIVIPERSALVITNGEENVKLRNGNAQTNGSPSELMPSRKDFYLSTPNLASSTMISQSSYSIDCNGNSKINQNHNDVSQNGNATDTDDNQQQVVEKNARNLYRGSVQNLSSADPSEKLPEPSPRKRIFQVKKKTAAPAPPPRGSAYFDDSISIASNTVERSVTPETPTTPVTPEADSAISILNNTSDANISREPPKPTMRETTTKPLKASTPVLNAEPPVTPEPRIKETPPNLPKPVPRITTTTLINAAPMESAQTNNVSKVMLNRTPTPEPRSLSTEPPYMFNDENTHITNAHLLNGNSSHDEDDNVSKQADSGIGEPVPSPIPDSLPSEISAMDCKSSTFESSSDDDDIVKVYNFKLGKTSVKPIDELHKTLDDLSAIAAEEADSADENMSAPVTADASIVSESSWNFQIPISPPPNFADSQKAQNMAEVPETPITPKIKERPVLDFKTFSAEAEDQNKMKAKDIPDCSAQSQNIEVPLTPISSTVTPLIEELAAIIQEKRMESLIKKAEETTEIEAAKPNTLSNFSIASMEKSTKTSQNTTDITNQSDQTVKAVEKSTELSQNTSFLFGATSEEKKVDLKSTEPCQTTSTPHNLQEEKKFVDKSVECNQNRTSSPSIVMEQRKSESKTAEVTANTPSSPESAPEEEKLYRKRGSITNLVKQRRSITRADSFHTTMQSQKSTQNAETFVDNGNGMNSRSSSYLSLTKLEQNGLNLQRRRSSSELSIGESPALQSLEIMKTILNSRKNSLNNSGSDGESKTPSIELINRMESPIKTTAEVKSKSLIATSQTTEEPVKPLEPAAKELPKVYRYSGPPSINFSTWSERPKVQVAIKNEGDYIFGGKNSNSQSAAVTHAAVEFGYTADSTTSSSIPRNYRASLPTEDFRNLKLKKQPVHLSNGDARVDAPLSFSTAHSSAAVPPPVAPKPNTPIARMGIPEKEFKVPITVKPLNDVIVESVELREQPKTTVTAGHTTTVTLNGVSDVKSVETTATQRTQASNTSTLPRSNNNRFSTPPAAGPALLRATSITQLETNKPKSTTNSMEKETAAPAAAPFGQNTLRRTGFKEKILAKEEKAAAQSKNQIVVNSTKSTQNVTTTTVTKPAQIVIKSTNSSPAQNHNNSNIQTHTILQNSTQKPPLQAKNLQSAKLELKLQKSTSVYVNQISSPVTPTVATPQSAPLAPPPPPQPFKLKPTVTNKRQGGTVTPTSDPRDQLMAAIRNFKRDELNRS